MTLTPQQRSFVRDLTRSKTKRALLKAELQMAQCRVRTMLLGQHPPILPSPTPSRLLDPSLFRQERKLVPLPAPAFNPQPSTYL